MLHRFLRPLPDKGETYLIVLRTSPDFDALSLTKLHGRFLTFERELIKIKGCKHQASLLMTTYKVILPC